MIRPMRTTIAAALLVAAFGAAQAADEPAKVPLTTEQRQDNQAERIQAGKSNGELTSYEAKRLRREQKLIDKAEDHANADGKVTKKEERRLHRMQNAASKDIKRQNHDKAEHK